MLRRIPFPTLTLRDHPGLFDAFLMFAGVAFDFLPGTVSEDAPAAALRGP